MFWLGLALTFSGAVAVTIYLVAVHWYLRICYLYLVVRIFQEKPLFIVPFGPPVPDAEDVAFPTPNGLTLRGCYLKARVPRRGVILFGLEFGSNRWSCLPYVEHLLDAGFDVFAFESCGQADSNPEPGYEPLQWVTDHEVRDTQAALAYLKSRPDADPRGVGFFGISKGAGAGLQAAVSDPYIRCCVTDGVFSTFVTLVPYMRKFFTIYNTRYRLQGLLPSWFYGRIGRLGLQRIERQRHCCFPHLERVISKLAPRPLLMIHGGADSYIKPAMAEALFDKARAPKELWMVKCAKHNQALTIAGDEYRRRVLEFFERHLASSPREAGAGNAPRDTASRVPLQPASV